MKSNEAKIWEMNNKWNYEVGDLSCHGFSTQLEAATEAIRHLVASSSKMSSLLLGKPLEQQVRCVFGSAVYADLFDNDKMLKRLNKGIKF